MIATLLETWRALPGALALYLDVLKVQSHSRALGHRIRHEVNFRECMDVILKARRHCADEDRIHNQDDTSSPPTPPSSSGPCKK